MGQIVDFRHKIVVTGAQRPEMMEGAWHFWTGFGKEHPSGRTQIRVQCRKCGYGYWIAIGPPIERVVFDVWRADDNEDAKELVQRLMHDKCAVGEILEE